MLKLSSRLFLKGIAMTTKRDKTDDTTNGFVTIETITDLPASLLTKVSPEQFKHEQLEPRVSLLIHHRGGAGVVHLQPGQSVLIGRSTDADFLVEDPMVSRRHALFTYGADGAVWVEDLGSSYGTTVNGKRVTRHRLVIGDEVALYSVIVQIHDLGVAYESLHGFGSHENFIGLLKYEIARSKSFGKTVGLIMAKAAPGKETPFRACIPKIQQLLRPADRLGLYSQDMLEIMLPETTEASTVELANLLSNTILLTDHPKQQHSIYCGVAVFPGQAGTADALISICRSAIMNADEDRPIVIGPGAIHVAATTKEKSFLEEDFETSLSPEMKAVYEKASLLADSDVSVLIVGETGVGKEVIARYIHEHSRRKDKPIVAVNCGALPEGLVESTFFGHIKGAFTGADREQKGVFEAADQGTLLLDEVGELPLLAQAKLLRVIETKRVTRVGATKEIPLNVRIIALTHRDLSAMCHTEDFRRDLFFRLSTMVLSVPPLKNRSTEIVALAEHFLSAEHGSSKKLSDDAKQMLIDYTWPGNVRELRNVMERAVLLTKGATITAEDLSFGIGDRPTQIARASDLKTMVNLRYDSSQLSNESLDFKERIQQIESEMILNALREANWNQTVAARILKIPPRTLTRKIEAYDLKKHFRDSDE